MSTTAKISWVDGALLVAEGGSGHTITMDGSPDIGGRNLASRPMEVLLMGMGGCTAIDVVSMLKKQRQDIEGVEVSLVAERADSLSDETYCSATAMVRKSAEITHEVVLVEI